LVAQALQLWWLNQEVPMTLRRIVTATDFTEIANRALDISKRLADKASCPVDLIHSYDPVPLGPAVSYPATIWSGGNFAEQMKAEAESLLRDTASKRLAGIETKTAALAARNIAHSICDHADKAGADLLIVGTHGRTGVAHLLLGSVAERVIRHAPCSVLAVRPTVDAGSFPTRILVATDFSEASEGALKDASWLAEAFDATTTILHVYSNEPRPQGKAGYRALADVEGELREALAGLSNAHFGGRAEVDLVASSPPALAIAQYAQTHQFDLVVLGTHGRTGLRRMLIGSVAEKTARISPCPVWTARLPAES
jgi:nucleotide-binding universal stress UspA family protein